MKQSAALKYSLITSLKQISPFYTILFALLAIFCLLNMSTSIGESNLGSWDLMAIFAATAIPAGFKERFLFFLQNGYSRKTIFMNFLVSFVVISLSMAFLEIFILEAANLLEVGYHPMFNSIYASRYLGSEFSLLLESFLWHATAYIAMMSISFIGIIYFYRASKTMKTIVFIVIPTALILGLPIMDYILTDGMNMTAILFKFLLTILGLYQQMNPYIAMGSFSIIAIIGLISSYALIRRVNIQK